MDHPMVIAAIGRPEIHLCPSSGKAGLSWTACFRRNDGSRLESKVERSFLLWQHRCARTLHQHLERIDAGSIKSLGCSVWPAYFEPIHFGCRSEAEVQSHIALGHVTAAASDLRHLDKLTCSQGNSRADRITIGVSAHQPKRNPVPFLPSIPEQVCS
jgi:hypothetical protein